MPMTASVMMSGAKYLDAVGEEREIEAQQPVSSHLQKHARQDHGAGGRRFRMRVRQPCVEGEERNLDAEGEGEGQEEPELARAASIAPALSAS